MLFSLDKKSIMPKISPFQAHGDIMKLLYSFTVCALLLLAGCAHEATKSPAPVSPDNNDLMIGNRGSAQSASSTPATNDNTPLSAENLAQRKMSLNIYEQKLNAYKAQLDTTREQLAAQAQQLKEKEQDLNRREALLKQNGHKKAVAKNTAPANTQNTANVSAQAETNAENTPAAVTNATNNNQELSEMLHKLQNGTYNKTSSQ
jgi:hypothetical protein